MWGILFFRRHSHKYKYEFIDEGLLASPLTHKGIAPLNDKLAFATKFLSTCTL